MRTVVVIVAVLLSAACATLEGGSGKNANEEVATATAQWAAAFNSRDPERITSLYAPDAAFWGTTARNLSVTPAAIAEYFRDVPQRPNARVNLGEQHIRVYGDIAVNTGYYTFSGPGRGGNTADRPARYTFVYANRNGKWWIIEHHSSFMPRQ